MPNLIENIKASEGFRSRSYRCTENHLTIGYGFKVADLVFSRDICDKILETKVAELKLIVNQKIPFIDDLPEIIQEVLYEMYYQMGNSLFKFKKTLKHLENKDYRLSAKEMLLSKWYRQTPNRAKKLSDIVKYAN